MKGRVKNKKVMGYVFVNKFDGQIMEAYDTFGMFQAFDSLRAARLYAKRIYTKKQWPNWQKDIKIVPVTLTHPSLLENK